MSQTKATPAPASAAPSKPRAPRPKSSRAAGPLRAQPNGPRPTGARVPGANMTRMPRAQRAARAAPVAADRSMSGIIAADNASAAASLYQEICPEDDSLNVGLPGSGELVGTSVVRGEARVTATWKYNSTTNTTYAMAQFNPSLVKTVMHLGSTSTVTGSDATVGSPHASYAVAWTGISTFTALAGALELLDFDQLTDIRGQAFLGLLNTPMFDWDGSSTITSYGLTTATQFGNNLSWVALADLGDSTLSIPWAPPVLSDRQARPRAWDYANTEFPNTCGSVPTIIITLPGDQTATAPIVTFRCWLRAQVTILPSSTVNSALSLWSGGGNTIAVPSDAAYTNMCNKLVQMTGGVTARNAASPSEWKTLKAAARSLFKQFTSIAKPLAKRSILGAVSSLLHPIFGAEADAHHALDVTTVPLGHYTDVELARMVLTRVGYAALTLDEIDRGRRLLAFTSRDHLDATARLARPTPATPAPSEASSYVDAGRALPRRA